jgi:hypothetical protein
VPGEKRKARAWLHEKDLGGFYFVQFITLDPAGREPSDITRAWIRQLIASIRKHDSKVRARGWSGRIWRLDGTSASK